VKKQLDHLPAKKINRIFSDILHGISKIHSLGIIHGDLRLENFIVQPNNKIKIIDYSISTIVEGKQPPYINKMFFKTQPKYFPKELREPEEENSGYSHIDYKTDVFHIHKIAKSLKLNFEDFYDMHSMIEQAKSDKLADRPTLESLQNKFHEYIRNHKQQEKKLLSVLSTKVDVLEHAGHKMLLKGQIQDEGKTDSAFLASWDRYFLDLSKGSFRDLEQKPLSNVANFWRARTWYYLFKNLMVIQDLFESSKNDEMVLDVGCSSGYFRRFIEGNYSLTDGEKKIYYWGIDARHKMLRKAIFDTNDIESGAAGELTYTGYLWHDISFGLPFKKNSFSFIVCFELIKYLPIEQGILLLRNCVDVLKPGGKMYISTTFGGFDSKYIGSLSMKQFSNIIKSLNCKLLKTMGAVSSSSKLLLNLRDEHQHVYNELLEFHPREIVNAFFTPLYPELSSQVTYYITKD
jgi:serine/threonine protein kinase